MTQDGTSPKRSPAEVAARAADAQVDVRLIEAAQGGDRTAMAELLTRHEARIFGLCRRMVAGQESAEDLTQDVLVKIIENLSSFDGRASFTTWLTRIAMNTCLSHLRKDRLRRHASLDSPVGGGAGSENRPGWASTPERREPGAVTRVQHRDEISRLERALTEIDPEQRGLLILRDVHGLDHKQLADTLGVAVGTVKSRLFRARAALREAMERMGSTGEEGARDE